MVTIFLSDRNYKIAKFVAQILLPAIGTLYFGLAAIWNLPAPEKVIGSITVVDTFLGVILGLSSSAYSKSETQYAGSINVHEAPDKTVYSLDLEGDPADLKNKDKVTFKINAKT